MKRRVIALWLPRLATDRLRRQAGQDDAIPLAMTAEDHGRLVLAAVDARAAQAGLHPGMSLADARAVAPELRSLPAEPHADAVLLDRLVTWCGRYTPWVAAAGTDTVFLDVTGCAHLFGGGESEGESAMCHDLLRRVESQGFAARVALADTPGAAWALAHHGPRNAAVVAPGMSAEALARLPVAALRLDPDTVEGLSRVGVKRIAQLRAMPRAPLTARFGTEAGRRLDQASGALREPISPRAPVSPFRARMAFAEPIALQADVERGLDHLLADLCRQLDEAGRGARQLTVSLYRVDGEVIERRVGAARPARDAARLARPFAERLGGFDPGFGIEAMVLSAPVSEALTPAAGAGLIAEQTAEDCARPDFDAAALAPLIDRIGNRIGFGRVQRLGARQSHLPERAVCPAPAPGEELRFVWPQTPLRPLRLLVRPERIEAITLIPPGEPGDPPAWFRWRRVDHRIRAAEGPERIAPEWWIRNAGAKPGRTRDYWRVEDTEGRRFWIYRHGLPRRDRPPDWYLHGLFA